MADRKPITKFFHLAGHVMGKGLEKMTARIKKMNVETDISSQKFKGLT
ncbi:MAG: hypothetical protein QXV32_09590 [Conexivisphaerales archaeon]